jgi:hypothetical protein
MHKPGLAFQGCGRQILWCKLGVLDPGLPPEQLIAPARGRTPRQRGYSLSKCNEHVCHDYAGF